MNAAAATVVSRGLGSRYTAAVLRIERHGVVRFERAFGTLAQPPDRAAGVTTRFDLASITKVVVSTAALHAAADGVLALDDPLVPFVPEWRGTAHATITLRDLLAHVGGFASGADYRTLLAWDVERFALVQPLAHSPRARVLYSDLGFIALGVVLARARRAGLSRVIGETLRLADCTSTSYRPRNDDPSAVPATECDAWRGRVRGSVHDEKAALMNGVAGHAGLFGTARDVARVADIYLAAACGRETHALPVALALDAIAQQAPDPVLRRGLGWALKTSDENSCGARMSGATFGHTGFTGTVVWADPVRDLSIVLLTNAVYFGRRDLRDLRAAVCDAAVQEFAA